MAELLIKIGNSRYEDGDILCAFNNKRISLVHLSHLCKPELSGFNKDNLRYPDSLFDVFNRNIYQYKFERISEKEIKRIVIDTDEYEILSDAPNEKKEQIDVPLFIARRKASPRHQIFGSKGHEYWYGGRSSNTKLDDIWTEVEARTEHRKVNYTKFPITSGEKRNYLALSVDDFNDEIRGELESPLMAVVEGEEQEQTLKKRKHWVDYKKISELSSFQNNILDKNVEVDLRDNFTLVRNQIIKVKS